MHDEYPWRQPKRQPRTSEQWQQIIDDAVRRIDDLPKMMTNSSAIHELSLIVKELTNILQTLTNRERVIEHLEDADSKPS